MAESSSEESLLSLLGEDIAFSLIDPISKGIVSVVPDSVFQKIADFEIANPWFGFVRGKVMIIVRIAAMKFAKIKLGGTVSPAVEKDLNDKLDDVVNGVIRKVDALVKERTTGTGGVPGAHGTVAAKPGDLLVIRIVSTRWIHASKDCYILQDTFEDNTVVDKVVEEEDDKSQQNQQGKKKGNQKKKTEKTITRIPSMKTRTAEQAAQGIQDGDYRVCPNPACGARERIAAVAKKEASNPTGMPLRPWFAEAVTRITASLNDAHRDLFADEVGLATREPDFWKKMEQYKEFHKELTLLDLITLFQLPARPALPPKEAEPEKPTRPAPLTQKQLDECVAEAVVGLDPDVAASLRRELADFLRTPGNWERLQHFAAVVGPLTATHVTTLFKLPTSVGVGVKGVVPRAALTQKEVDDCVKAALANPAALTVADKKLLKAAGEFMRTKGNWEKLVEFARFRGPLTPMLVKTLFLSDAPEQAQMLTDTAGTTTVNVDADNVTAIETQTTYDVACKAIRDQREMLLKDTDAKPLPYDEALKTHAATVTAMRTERARLETEYATTTLPQWERDCDAVRTQREALFAAAKDGLDARKKDAFLQRKSEHLAKEHEEKVKKEQDAHHEKEETEKAEKWGQATFGLTEAESKGDFSRTVSFIWDIFPFSLLREWRIGLIPQAAPPAAPAAGNPQNHNHNHGGHP